MTRTRTIGLVIASLFALAVFAANNQASAHTVSTGWVPISSSGDDIPFYHSNPFLGVHYNVGYKLGSYNAVTNIRTETPNEWVVAWNLCYTGVGYTTPNSGWFFSTIGGQWVSAGNCGGATFVGGGVWISE
jgi:hypothetical protein